jgi:hypothetical protein
MKEKIFQYIMSAEYDLQNLGGILLLSQPHEWIKAFFDEYGNNPHIYFNPMEVYGNRGIATSAGTYTGKKDVTFKISTNEWKLCRFKHMGIQNCWIYCRGEYEAFDTDEIIYL